VGLVDTAPQHSDLLTLGVLRELLEGLGSRGIHGVQRLAIENDKAQPLVLLLLITMKSDFLLQISNQICGRCEKDKAFQADYQKPLFCDVSDGLLQWGEAPFARKQLSAV